MKPATCNRWEDIAFGKVVSHSAFGPRFSGDAYAEDGNVATLRTTDLDDSGRISYDSMPLARLNEDQFANHLLSPGDLVITRSGTCGIAAVFEGFTLPVLPGAFLIRFRLNSLAEPRFFRYYFNSPAGRMNILSVARGAVQQNLNITNVQTLRVPLPPLPEQHSIVNLLSAYDDLIENNRRRMVLLEKAARLLYEEWFVRLRFPGHERTRIIDGVPSRWSWSPLESICLDREGIQTGPFGSQLHQSDYSDDGVPVVMPKNLISFRIADEEIARIPESLAQKLCRHRMIAGDTVCGRRGDIGRRAFISARQVGWICGTGCLRIRPDPGSINPRFLFDALGSPETAGTIANRAKGATMLNLNSSVLKSVPVLVAPQDLQDLYADQVESMALMVELLSEQNQKLRAARDLLLPRLMSGEIAV